MVTMNISAARDHLPEAVETARTETVFIERYGHLAGVLVSPERYRAADDRPGGRRGCCGLRRGNGRGGPEHPREQVKADLGWV